MNEKVEMDLDFETPLTVERLQGLADVLKTLAEATRKRSTSDDVDYYVGAAAKKLMDAIGERVAYEQAKWKADHDVAFPPEVKDAEAEK